MQLTREIPDSRVTCSHLSLCVSHQTQNVNLWFNQMRRVKTYFTLFCYSNRERPKLLTMTCCTKILCHKGVYFDLDNLDLESSPSLCFLSGRQTLVAYSQRTQHAVICLKSCGPRPSPRLRTKTTKILGGWANPPRPTARLID